MVGSVSGPNNQGALNPTSRATQFINDASSYVALKNEDGIAEENQSWPPKGSTPYTGNILYYPSGEEVPNDRLVAMPDGSVFYRSTGTESVRTLTYLANGAGNHYLSNDKFKLINQLPIVYADDARPFKKDQPVLLKPKAPAIATKDKAYRNITSNNASVVSDNDRYIRDNLEKTVTVNDLNIAKSYASSVFAKPAIAAQAEENLIKKFGRPYLDAMQSKWRQEQLELIHKQQGTIDLPPEEKQARERANFMQSLDKEYGALSPVIKFFLPTYAMPELGLSPSPIEIITDIGAGLHFSPKPTRLVGYNNGRQTMAEVEFDPHHIYYVPEPQRITSKKPGNIADFTEVRTAKGETVWLPKNSVQVTSEQARGIAEWTKPAIDGSNPPNARKAPKAEARSDHESAQQEASGKPNAGMSKTPNKANAKPPVSQPSEAVPAPQPKVMTSTGKVESQKPAPVPEVVHAGRVGEDGRPNITNLVQKNDPAYEGINELRRIIEAPIEEGGLNQRFYERRGLGFGRSVDEPDKVIFSTNTPVDAALIKKAFKRDIPFETQKVGSNYIVKLDIPHPEPKTGGTGRGPRVVNPREVLEDMQASSVSWGNMDDISPPRGRVRDPVNAENSLLEQDATLGSDASTYHENVVKSRVILATGVEKSAPAQGLYFKTPEDMMKTLDAMNRTMARPGAGPRPVTPGELRHAERLFFGPAPASDIADVATIAAKYGVPFKLVENSRLEGKHITPAMSPELWSKYNPSLPYDAALVNPSYDYGLNWQYAGTKTVKAGSPDFARQMTYEKAVVDTYQRVAFEKGKAAMEKLVERNNISPENDPVKFAKANQDMLETLGEHAYYLFNARKYDNSNASVYMNEVNMLLNMSGLDEVPHGVLDHCAYRFPPEAFKRYFADWVMKCQEKK